MLDRIKTVLIGGTCNLFKKLGFFFGLITHGICDQFYIKPHLLLVYTSIWKHFHFRTFCFKLRIWINKFTDKKHSSVYKWLIQCKKVYIEYTFLTWLKQGVFSRNTPKFTHFYQFFSGEQKIRNFTIQNLRIYIFSYHRLLKYSNLNIVRNFPFVNLYYTIIKNI